jgi:hypothetical protein
MNKAFRWTAVGLAILSVAGVLYGNRSIFGQGFGYNAQVFQQRWADSQRAQEWTAQAAQRAAMERANRRWQSSHRPTTTYSAPQDYQTSIQRGDKVVTTESPTPLKIGEKTVGEVSRGTALSVIRRQGAWIAVRVSDSSGSVAGWIHVRHVRKSGAGNGTEH